MFTHHSGNTEGPPGDLGEAARPPRCIHALGCCVHVLFGFLRAGEIVIPSDTSFDPSCHLVHGNDGRLLTQDRFVTAVRSALAGAGYNCSLYAGHSFHIGAATTAAQCGISDALIKTLDRWQSSAYTVYIQTPTTPCVP